jgi:uncharacterized protein (TIGR00369 family)
VPTSNAVPIVFAVVLPLIVGAANFGKRLLAASIQGGMLAAMLDSATGNAVMANLPHDRTAVTTRLDTTFLKPATLGPLTATAHLVRQDERSALAEAELVDSSGQIVARARAELRVRQRDTGV